MAEIHSSPTLLPRVTIQFCTQCKWMLRAAYFAQELLSTFSNSLGEVALQPSTGGTFIVEMYHASLDLDGETGAHGDVKIERHLLWDRKAEGRFPETKELKRRVRDIIDPNRDLGHVDGKKNSTSTSTFSQELLPKKCEQVLQPLSSSQPIQDENDITEDGKDVVSEMDSINMHRTNSNMQSGSHSRDGDQEQIANTKRRNSLLDNDSLRSGKERKFTPMDVDAKDERKEGDRVCEDCV